MTFKVDNLTKVYKKQRIIDRFSFEFNPGLYLFTGRNGSGKSTTIKMFADVIYPSNYSWYKSEARISYLCEKVELSNGKVTPFLKDILHLSKMTKNLKELMLKWNIPDKNMLHLSKGNKQKVGILMMLLSDSDLYLFDEPTDALDQKTIFLFVEAIKELLQKGKTVIISTHEKHYFAELNYKEITFDLD